DVAAEVLAELIHLREPLILLANHPETAPGLIGGAAFAGIEGDVLDVGAELAQGGSRIAADRIDFGFNADAGDVGDVRDAQALDVMASLKFAARALPRRCDRNR